MLRALDPAHVFPVALTLLTRNTDRFRFKFIFGRRVDPQPSWDHRSDEAQVPFEELTTEPLLVPAMESMWNWMTGKGDAVEAEGLELDLEECAAVLQAPSEPGDEAARVGASYQLGLAANAGDRRALECLVEALTGSSVHACRRVAVHGLQAAGNAAVPALLEILAESDSHETLMHAVDALGEGERHRLRTRLFSLGWLRAHTGGAVPRSGAQPDRRRGKLVMLSPFVCCPSR